MRLPTGRVLAYTHEDSGRASSVSSGATAYVSAVVYADHGAVKEMRLNGYRMREKVTFDPQRLQPTAIAVEHCTDNQAACVSPSALLTLGYVRVFGKCGWGAG